MDTNTTPCDTCENPIDLTDEDRDFHQDDSGNYHGECYRAEVSRQMADARKTYTPQPDYDLSDAYEWGDPKNPRYAEWLLDEADRVRKGE